MKGSKFPDARKALIRNQGADGIPIAEICRQAGIMPRPKRRSRHLPLPSGPAMSVSMTSPALGRAAGPSSCARTSVMPMAAGCLTS